MKYVPIHTHSDHSLLDGIATVEEIAKAAKRLKCPACALTDHGTTTGLILFQDACEKHGIKPILGVELYVNDFREHTDQNIRSKDSHICLLVKNEKGWKNLCYLVSEAYRNGFYYRAKTTNELILNHHEGIIVTTACIQGILSRCNYRKAYNLAKKYKKVFGDDFYIELQINELSEQKKLNQRLISIAERLNIKTIIGLDSHYVFKKDAEIQDVFLMMKFNKNEMEFRQNKLGFKTRHLYMKTAKKIFDERDLFCHFELTDELIERSLKNTLEIAEKCNFKLEFKKFYFPRFCETREKEIELFNELIDFNFDKLINQGKIPDDKIEIYEKRLDRELKVILDKKFAPYFLVLWDIMKYCRENDIFVGPGRGSSCSSLVSYILGITNVDPIKHGLFFERFLDPSKVDMPDVDIDFESEKKQQVEEYIVNRYGSENTCKIISFNTIQIKKSLETLIRLLNLPKELIDVCYKVRKLLPDLGATYDDLYDLIQENSDFYDVFNTPKGQDLLYYLEKLIGRISNYGKHAAGIIITPEPVYNYMPVQKVKDIYVSTFTEGTREKNISRFGLLKIDILGLTNLSIVKDTLRLIKKTRNKDVNIDLTDGQLNDKSLFNYLRKGETAGIFQFESSSAVHLLKEAKVDCFFDLVVINALNRPATLKSGQTEQYIKNKMSGEEIKGISEYCEELNEILSPTYGILTFQEQIIQIFHKVAHIELTKANKYAKLFIKGIATEEQKSEIEEQFVSGCEKSGMSNEQISHLWLVIKEFSQYSFNKSHATSYSIITMQNLYLKYYYYIEYMSVLLTYAKNSKDSPTKTTTKFEEYCREIKRSGYNILPVDINKSKHECLPEGKKSIRVGFSKIKDIGEIASIELSKNNHKINDITNLFDGTLDRRRINKKVILALAKVGALDSLYSNRKGLIKFIEYYYSFKAVRQREKIVDNIYHSTFRNIPDFDEMKKQEMEKEYYNFYLRSHPFDKYIEKLKTYNELKPASLRIQTPQKFRKSKGYICGVVTDVSAKIRIKNGLSTMRFVTISDKFESVKLVLFSEDLTRYGHYFKKGNAVVLKYTYNKLYNSISILQTIDGKKPVAMLLDVI